MQNLITYSEDFSQAAWVATNTSKALSAGTSNPVGATGSVYLITSTGAGGVNHYVEQTTVRVAGLARRRTYTLSCWVKASTTTKCVVGTSLHSNWYRAMFDLSAKVVGFLDGVTQASIVESLTNPGWFRCSVTYQLAPGDVLAADSVSILVAPMTSGAATANTGYNQSGEAIFVAMAQITETTGPTDYVKTTSTIIDEGAPRGALEAENGFLQSEDLSTSWTGVAASAGTGTDFEGNTTNCAIVEDGTNAGHYFTQTPNAGAAKDRIMTAMCLAKAGTRNYLCIAPAGAGVQVTFDLTTGVATFNQGSGVNAAHRLGHGAIPLKNGWFLCYVIFRQDTTATPVRFYAGNSTTGAAAYTGTNGNKAIYITRMQLSCSNGPGRYTKTTTIAATGRATRGHAIQNLVATYINDSSWAWTGVQAVTADPTPTPWGTTAYRLVENTANSAHAVQASGSTYTLGRILSMRVRLKAGTRTWAVVGIGGGGIAAWINLSTGAFGTANGFIEKDIRSLGSGWYEVTLSAATPNTGGPTVYATTGDGVAVYTGDGASYVLVAEAQMAETRSAVSQLVGRHQGRAPRSLMRPWNLCKSSQNLHGDTTNWTAIGSVVRAASSFMAPDGSMTASNLSDTSNSEYRGVTQAITVPKDARSYCFSIYIRGGSTTPVFGINAQIGGGTTVAMSFRFDPSTGQFTNGSQRSNAERVIAPDGSPWYRIWCVLRNNGTNNTLQVNLYAATSTSIGAGDTVAGQGNVDLWGAQINEGEGPLDYVATTTTAVALPGAPARRPEELENLIVSTSLVGLTQSNILVPTVDVAAPTGTLSYRLRENSTAGVAHVAQGTISNLRKGNVVTMSCLAKVGAGRTWLALGGNSGNSTSWFDIQNVVLGNIGALLYGNPTIRSIGNGWVFCSQSFILDPTTPLVNFYLASANGVAVYNGDGASYMLISDIQVTYSNGPTSKRTTYPYNQSLDRGRSQRALIL